MEYEDLVCLAVIYKIGFSLSLLMALYLLNNLFHIVYHKDPS